MKARSGIGGKADRRLEAQGVQRQDARLLDLPEERPHKVARHSEHFARPMRVQRAKQYP